MIDDRYLDLIHREVDGLNGPEERAALQAFLDTDAEARSLYSGLMATAALLGQVEPREAPPHLKDAVMRALPLEMYAPAPPRKRPGLLAVLSELLQARPRLALACVFASGLLVGLAVFGALQGPALAPGPEVYGTLVSRDAASALASAREVPFSVDDIGGSVRLNAGADQVLLELELEALHPFDLQLAFDEASLRLRGFTRLGDDRAYTLTSEAGTIRLTTQGSGTFLVVFDRQATASPAIGLRVLREGAVRYHTIFAIE